MLKARIECYGSQGYLPRVDCGLLLTPEYLRDDPFASPVRKIHYPFHSCKGHPKSYREFRRGRHSYSAVHLLAARSDKWTSGGLDHSPLYHAVGFATLLRYTS